MKWKYKTGDWVTSLIDYGFFSKIIECGKLYKLQINHNGDMGLIIDHDFWPIAINEIKPFRLKRLLKEFKEIKI